MVTDTSFIKPKAPFVIVTRKGGFPAATLVEAQRVVRPLVTDEKTCVTDAAGRKYTAREFLNAAQQAADAPAAAAQAPQPTDLKDWASATADIDLDGEAPPGWTPPPPTPSRGAPAAARSSARIPSPGARSRPTSDRRPTGARRRDDDGSETKVLLVVGMVVLAFGLIAVLWSLQASPAAGPAAPEAQPPATRPSTPAHPALTPDGRVRPEDRPLPTYMR